MNAQKKLFKDVQMVLVDNNPIITNNNDESDLVFFDDDTSTNSSESEANPMDVKVKSELNYDDDESNQSMVVEPDEIVAAEETIHDENEEIVPVRVEEGGGVVGEDICVKHELPADISDLIPENEDQNPEEQFELIETEQSFESVSSTLNDHSYSQANPKMQTSFCDDIVDTILSKTDLSQNPNALELLSSYTSYLEIFTASEDPTSQVNQYVQKMKDSLQSRALTISPRPSTSGLNNRVKPPIVIDKDVIEIDIEKEDSLKDESKDTTTPELPNNTEFLTAQDSMELFNTQSEEEAINDELEKEMEDIIMECVKEEPEFTVECSQEKPEIVEESQNDAVEKLKSYIQNASNLSGSVLHSFRDLSELKYENDEDISNGKLKLLTTIKSVIKQNCMLMMEIEEVEESDDIKMEDFIENAMLNMTKSYIAEKKEVMSDIETSNNSETDDDVVNKLCNLNNLKISNTKGDRTVEVAENDVKKLRKKKDKKLKPSSDNSDISSEEDANDENKRSSESEVEGNSSDEEKKMVEKHENNVKNLLLGSTDEEDESDDSIYATSESSLASLTNKLKKKKRDSKKKSDNESEKSESEKSGDEEEEKSQKSPTKIDKETKESSESETESTSNENKAKKKKKKPIFGNSEGIFKKDFLDIDDSDKEEKPARAKVQISTQKSTSSSTSDKNEPQSEAIDLTQFSARQIEVKSSGTDLSKYIQKMNEKSTNNEPPTKPTTPAAVPDNDECYIISSDSDSEISSSVAEGKTRRRKELSPEELKEETKKAQKAEKERIKKLDKKKDALTQYLTQRTSQLSEEDDVICSDDLTLDYSNKLKLAINVHPKLVDQLKEHQKDGVKFMYDK